VREWGESENSGKTYTRGHRPSSSSSSRCPNLLIVFVALPKSHVSLVLASLPPRVASTRRLVVVGVTGEGARVVVDDLVRVSLLMTLRAKVSLSC
jgi:hypothetical protein